MAKGEFVKQSFTGLPTWAKGVIAVGILAGVGFIVYKVIKTIGDKEDREKNKRDKAEINDVEKELNKLNEDPSKKQTISTSEASGIANKLFAAMNGMGTTTTEIETQLLRLKNQADWLAVRAGYGTRTLNSGVWGVADYTGTLEGALTDELGVTDDSTRKKVNTHFQKVGITARI